jgi:hypothetical protein
MLKTMEDLASLRNRGSEKTSQSNSPIFATPIFHALQQPHPPLAILDSMVFFPPPHNPHGQRENVEIYLKASPAAKIFSWPDFQGFRFHIPKAVRFVSQCLDL